MIDPEDLHLSEQQLKEFMVRKTDGRRKPRARKESKVGFLKVPIALAHKLHDDKANGDAWAMVMALTEAWFTTGIYSQHPNPFSLSVLDSKQWGFTRKQKSRTLQFLSRIRLIVVGRQNPENPLVTIAWEPRYPPQV